MLSAVPSDPGRGQHYRAHFARVTPHRKAFAMGPAKKALARSARSRASSKTDLEFPCSSVESPSADRLISSLSGKGASRAGVNVQSSIVAASGLLFLSAIAAYAATSDELYQTWQRSYR